ncbi:MAG: ABC transporter transmembrane domain-containing protein, partial [Pseudomonadota bacterium]
MTARPAADLPHPPDPTSREPIDLAARGAIASDAYRPLLDCLVVLSRFHGRPSSANSLTAGLPLTGSDLPPSLFARAARRAGLNARAHKRSIDDIPAILLPAVLILRDGSACLLIGLAEDGSAEIYLPEAGGISRTQRQDLEARYAGTAFFVKPAIESLSTADDAGLPRPNRWFFGIVSRFWPTYGEAVLAAALVNILALAVPLFTMNVYDRVIPNQAIPTLWVLALGVIIALTFDFALRGVRAALIDNAGRRADILISARIFEHVMGMQMTARPASTGAFANQLREFETVRDFFTSATLASVTDLLFIGLFIFIIWMIAGPVALVPACAVPAVILMGLLAQVPLVKAVRESQLEAAQKHAVLVETVGNLETVKTLGAEGWRQSLWERLVGKTARTSQTARFWSALSINLSTFVQQLVVV